MTEKMHHPANLAEFDALLQKPFLIVDFYADWCPPCQMIAPIFEQLASRNSPNVTFAKVNTDRRQDIARRYEVTSMPTFIFFRDGQIEGTPLKGAIPHILERFTGVFAQLARERKEKEAAAAGAANGDNDGIGAKDENDEKRDEGEAQTGNSDDARGAKRETGEDTTTVSGGYTLGAEGGKRSDWKVSLNG